MYNNSMKISISEARQKLPELVRRIKKDGDLRVQITVHGDVVAELRSCTPEPSPGAAARRLRELMVELPGHRGPKRNISKRINQHLYGEREG